MLYARGGIMVRRFVLVVSVYTALACLSPVLARSSIPVTATNWKFTPALITGRVGETITLSLSSSEGVHGISSDELGIHKTILFSGKKPLEVSFVPKKVGTYKIHCAIPCGPGHDDMILTVKVEA
jgi:heme/copper-type cytochrome/quinol oxidase subunit 2